MGKAAIYPPNANFQHIGLRPMFKIIVFQKKSRMLKSGDCAGNLMSSLRKTRRSSVIKTLAKWAVAPSCWNKMSPQSDSSFNAFNWGSIKCSNVETTLGVGIRGLSIILKKKLGTITPNLEITHYIVTFESKEVPCEFFLNFNQPSTEYFVYLLID